jgi:hypothetical protein
LARVRALAVPGDPNGPLGDVIIILLEAVSSWECSDYIL